VHKGVDWFEQGDWVATATPFDQPDWWDHGGHGGHGGDEEKQIAEMLAVLEVVQRAATRPESQTADAAAARLTGPVVPGPELTSFAHWLAGAELADDPH
jgi:hypothetical protein